MMRFTWESPVTFGRPTIVTLAISGRGRRKRFLS